ncbi:MAG: DUF4129 domain-containing protein [Micromonosporaceae bacterium]|nr:DUF4129 domain-containing protein [Micromonosporaceae bacterium]
MNRVLYRWAPLLAVCGLLVAAWLAAALASPQINNVPIPPLVAAASPEAEPSATVESSPMSSPAEDDATAVDSPDERAGLIAVVALFVVLSICGIVGWIMVRRRVAAAGPEPVVVTRRDAPRKARRASTVVEAVEAGLSDLSDTDADPRKAVIACWVRLERVAAAVGAPKHLGDSPTDLVVRLLHGHSVSGEALEDLAVVYREARFATDEIDESMRAEAVAALRQIRAELAREVSTVVTAQRGVVGAVPGSGGSGGD